MRILPILLAASAMTFGTAALAQDASAPVKTDQVTARLLAHAPEGVAPGKPVWLGLQIDHAPHWHTYWKNPGDSGLPTTLSWTLPAGVETGPIAWPAPHKLPVGPLVNYGFEGPLLLPVQLKLPAALPAGAIKIQLAANWLVCKELCIPESGEFTLELPQGQALTGQAAAFDLARQQQPQALQAMVAARVDGEALAIEVKGLPAAWLGQPVSYFAGDAGVVDHAQAEQGSWQGDTLKLRVALSPQRSESPAQLNAVLRVGEETGELNFALQGGWGDGGTATAAPAPALQPAQAPQEAGAGFLLSLVLAFAGGLLLNLMPCVFPVLSLKALALVNEAPHERRVGALAYTAGVVLSFLALAGLLLALRGAGSQIGWGFQLQEPLVVGGLALLFTLIALNLFGLFEFGNWAPSSLAGWRAKQPWVDQFATGVLGVAIASPCTAPFMGAALGAALTLPAWQGLAVFAALGLGLAAPYALVALWPPLARMLPRPGAWMVRLRTLLAFPMLATVLWLVWVLGVQRGLEASIAMLVLLLALSYAVWAWTQRGLAWRASALLALAGGAWWAAPLLLTDAPPAAKAPVAAGWQAWSPEAQARLLAEGKPVFVDFTAAWCISCQYNKRTALADAAVLKDFADRGVVLMRADWTLRDAVITEELRRLGRSGVPVYALHAPGAAAPVLLPEILSATGVRDALAASLKPS
jgi:thiol:disulfide interchange protein DsbD